MSEHSKRAYLCNHVPQIGDSPAGSFFIERFPVDRRDPEIDTLVRATIPDHLRQGLLLHNTYEEAHASREGGVPISWLNREAALMTATPEEIKSTEHRTFIHNALAQHGINYAFMSFSTSKGDMSEFAVAGIDERAPNGVYYELSGLLDPENGLAETGEFEVQERDATTQGIIERTPLDGKLALDFLTSITERRTGDLPMPSFSEQVRELYDASEDKYFKTGGGAELGGLAIEAELEEHIRNKISRVSSYSVHVHQQLPHVGHPDDATQLTLNLKQAVGKRGRREWQANLGMAVLTRDHQNTPDRRESRFENIAEFYREKPHEFYHSIAKAAEQFAAIEF